MQDILARIRAKKADEGFTLIELLVVVVIIGVLVAIAIPVYLNYRQGANDKSAQSDARGAISAVEQFYTNNNNTYPAAATNTGPASVALPALGGTAGSITLSNNTTLHYVTTGAPVTSYKICTNNSDGSGKYYLYDSSVGGSVKTAALTAVTFPTCG